MINGNEAKNRQADAEQAEYFRQLLSSMRAQAQSDLARHCIELQQLQTSCRTQRAADLRRVIRALEKELMTMERLGQGLNDWL